MAKYAPLVGRGSDVKTKKKFGILTARCRANQSYITGSNPRLSTLPSP